MLNWAPWDGAPDEWDKVLARFADRSIFQGYGWGEHKGHFGWRPHRLVATDNGEAVAMAQVLVRRFPLGVTLAWVNGGPVGRPDAWGEPMRAAVHKAAGTRHLYLRFNALREQSDGDAEGLRAAGWTRPTFRVGSGQSILMDLEADDADWLKSITSKHRYYVKKANKAPLNWVCGNTDVLRRDLVAMSQGLSVEKGLKLPEWDAASMENLYASIGEAGWLLVGYLEGKAVTGCLVLLSGDTGYYLSAATLGEGREVSAAYSMFAKLRSLLRERGVRTLDFGGINPAAESARGVDHFKRGFGGREIRYLGEWDWATSPLLRRAANFLIQRRARGL